MCPDLVLTLPHLFFFSAAFPDLSLRGFITYVIALSVISYICTSTNSLVCWSGILPFACHHGICLLVFLLYMGLAPCYAQFSLFLWIYPLNIWHLSQSALWNYHCLPNVSCVVCDHSSHFVTLTMHDFPLWSVLLPFTITQCIHGPSSCYCTATVGPTGREIVSLWVSFPFRYLTCPSFGTS